MTELLLKIFVKSAVAAGIGEGEGGGPTLQNPLGAGTTVATLLERITSYLLTLAIPVATVLILYGAFQILTAAGNTERVKAGRQTIIWTVVGFAIVLLASGIPYIIKEILGAQ